MKQDEALVMHSYNELTKETSVIAVKASKRGNDVYRWRLKNRFKELDSLIGQDDVSFFNRDSPNPKTRCIFVTFTYDIKRSRRGDAWKTIGEDYNKALSWMRGRYGPLSAFRVYESFENGYPHLHAIILFEDHQFDVFKDRASHYRIKQKGELEQSYHSFIDVEAITHLGSGLRYLVKYLRKVHDHQEVKSETTLAMMWIYGKRAFGLSGQFINRLRTYRLDHLLHNSKKSLGQMTLEGSPVKKFKWVYDGMVSWKRILDLRITKGRSGDKKNLWTYDITHIPKDIQSDYRQSHTVPY